MTEDPPQESPFQLQESTTDVVTMPPPPTPPPSPPATEGAKGGPPSSEEMLMAQTSASCSVADAKTPAPPTVSDKIDDNGNEDNEQFRDVQERQQKGVEDPDSPAVADVTAAAAAAAVATAAEATAKEEEENSDGSGEEGNDGGTCSEEKLPMPVAGVAAAAAAAGGAVPQEGPFAGFNAKGSSDTEEKPTTDGARLNNVAGQPEASRSGGAPGLQKPRKPHLQGRFSGRLETKTDEKKLQEECRLLGPMVGGMGKRGERSRMTLAKIVRAIASGDVRRHCVERESKIQELQERLKTMEAVYRREIDLLKQDIAGLRLRIELKGEEYNRHQIAQMGVLRGLKNNSHEPRVIITPATVPPMVFVRGANDGRYPASDPVASVAGGLPSLDVSSLPFLFPSNPNPQAQGLQGSSPITRTRMANLTPGDAERAAAVVSMQGNLTAEAPQRQQKTTLVQTDDLQAHARALAQVRDQVETTQINLPLKRKLGEMQAPGRGDLMGQRKPEDNFQAIVSDKALAELAVASAAKAVAETEDGAKGFQHHADQKSPQILKVVPAQVLPMSQNPQAGIGGSPRNIAAAQQQVTFLSVPGHGIVDNDSRHGLASAMGLVGGPTTLPIHTGQELRGPTVALTLGDDVASHQISQQAGLGGQKAVIVSPLQTTNAALAQGGPLASHLLSGQVGVDNVLSNLQNVESLTTSAAQTQIGAQSISQMSSLEESALSTPMEAEVMDPSVLEQLHAGDLDLATVAAAVPILQGAGAGTQIVMPVQMTSEGGRPAG